MPFSKWKTVIHVEAQMDSYPSDHELRFVYQAQDLNQDLLATATEHVKGEDVTITFLRAPSTHPHDFQMTMLSTRCSIQKCPPQ